jgi:hypothetical protein
MNFFYKEKNNWAELEKSWRSTRIAILHRSQPEEHMRELLYEEDGWELINSTISYGIVIVHKHTKEEIKQSWEIDEYRIRPYNYCVICGEKPPDNILKVHNLLTLKEPDIIYYHSKP